MMNKPASTATTTLSIAAIIMAVIGAICYLGGDGTIGSNGVESILVLILASVGITGVVHTTGSVVERTNGTTTTIVPPHQPAGAPPVTIGSKSSVVVLPDDPPAGPATTTAAAGPGPAMPHTPAG